MICGVWAARVISIVCGAMQTVRRRLSSPRFEQGMVESFLATIATKSRASNGRGRWGMCIGEASATSWIINTKVST